MYENENENVVIDSTANDKPADINQGNGFTMRNPGYTDNTTGNGTVQETANPRPAAPISQPRYSDYTAGHAQSSTPGTQNTYNSGQQDNRNYYSSGGTGFSGIGSGNAGYSTGYTGSSAGSTSGYSGSTNASGYTGTGNTTGYTGSAAGTANTAGYTGGTSQYRSTGYAGNSTYASASQPGYNRYTGTNGNNNEHHKHKDKSAKKGGKAAIAIAMVAVLLVGTIGGGAASYLYLNKRIDNVAESINKQANTKNDKIVEAPDRIELNKSDRSDAVKEKSNESVSEGVPTDGKSSVEEICAERLSSVVAITNYGVTEIRTMWGNFQQDSQSTGSGVVIGQTDEELLILTNYHVVADSRTLSVVFSWEDDEESIDDADIVTAVIKDYDENRDIAVIAIPIEELSDNALSQVTVAPIGSSDDLNLGEQVIVIGNALGYGQSVTTGIVSALNRKIGSADQYGNIDNNTYIQTDAAINPGNSGGAMFNMYGELVGVNSAKIGGTQVDSVGYAIPISDVLDEIEDMINQETRETVSLDQRGWLGVSIVDVTDEISATYGLPIGVYVSAIDSGSGAEKAGIKKEDVITAVNGKKVETGAQLKEYLSKYSVGETVTITVQRSKGNDYEEKEIDVVLGENPDQSVN